MELFLPGVVPPESRRSHFQMVLPLKWANEKYKPICVHFAGTGDHVRRKRTYFIIFRSTQLNAIKSKFAVLLATKEFHGKAVASRRWYRSYSIGESILWAA